MLTNHYLSVINSIIYLPYPGHTRPATPNYFKEYSLIESHKSTSIVNLEVELKNKLEVHNATTIR
ncbi:hypothetical protein ACMA1I_22935 [Pontibacter sp. 13R65]|uniref:hypothetical protein n=1 Tax=Pontibacter sp. 13R65 TaxID=3127458 RepID=UPI00301B736C